MVAVRVGHEHGGHPLTRARRRQRVDVRGLIGPRVDHGDLALPTI
jgi:hypothetical protein